MSPSTALHEIQTAIGTGKRLGDLIWFASRNVNRTTRSSIKANLLNAGLSEELAPEQPTAWDSLGEAHREWKRGRRPIQIDKERKDLRKTPWLIVHKDGRHYDPLASVSVNAAGDFQVEYIDPKPGVQRATNASDMCAEVVDEMRTAFEEHFNYVAPAEVTKMINHAILDKWGGIRLKEEGHVYWLPANGHSADLVQLVEVVGQIGDSYIRTLSITDSRNNRGSVAASAQEAFEAEIASLMKQVQELDQSKTRSATYVARIDAYKQLQSRVELYADLLGRRKDGLIEQLSKAKATVVSMLVDKETSAIS